MLSRGLAQLVAALWLVLGLVVLCGPAVMVTVVGGMVAGTAVLLLWRRAVPVGLAAVALALGAGLLALPEVMVAVTGGVLTLVGAVVLAVPPARAVYAHSERARVRSAYGVDGWAGWWDLHRQLSPHAVRLAAAATRPSVTAEASQLRAGGALAPGLVERLAVRRCETWLGRSVVGPVIGTECYAAHRDVVGLVAPPQTGRRR
ncbi:hypothetical protein [Pseudonocardia parietis]|uniref:Uncharacterized protein n=1 Tax=Pseudonocardia parietis TaxID=570936 RepID=A0ABS4W5C2_9PSEU|nr:hypothetical protein [Pseudonocardia parietis]MBP2371417.1 hypothetical protein [Pseudonocardia parietis]